MKDDNTTKNDDFLQDESACLFESEIQILKNKIKERKKLKELNNQTGAESECGNSEKDILDNEIAQNKESQIDDDKDYDENDESISDSSKKAKKRTFEKNKLKEKNLSKKENRERKKNKQINPKRVIVISIACIVAVFGLTLFAFNRYFNNANSSKTTNSLIRDSVLNAVDSYAKEPISSAKKYVDEITEVDSVMQVEFIDVGQGDCTLITCDGQSLLIDASLDEYGTYIQNYLQKRGIYHLDYVVLTHYDWDHAGGMDVILQKFDCDTIFMPSYVGETKYYRDVMLVIDAKKYKIMEPIVGTTFKVGDASATILAPSDYNSDDENDYSIVLMVRHGNNKFILTGDAELYSEENMVNGPYDITADVYKVGHHGSRSSSSDIFLDAVNPKYAIISCGRDNPYGHPTQTTLDKLKKRNIKTFRTDEQGTIIAISNGDDIYWNREPSTSWRPGEIKNKNNKKGK